MKNKERAASTVAPKTNIMFSRHKDNSFCRNGQGKPQLIGRVMDDIAGDEFCPRTGERNFYHLYARRKGGAQ